MTEQSTWSDRLEGLARWCARAGGALIAVTALIIAGDVVSRNIFGTVAFNAFELSTYLFAAAVALGLASTALNGAHIRIDIVLQKLPPAPKRLLNCLAYVSLAVLAVCMVWFAVELVLESHARGVRSNSAMAVKLYVPQAFWALGLCVFALAAIWFAVRYAVALLRGDHRLADGLSAAGNAGADPDETVEISGARGEVT